MTGQNIKIARILFYIIALTLVLAALVVSPTAIKSFIWPDNMLGTVSPVKLFILENFKIILLAHALTFLVAGFFIARIIHYLKAAIKGISNMPKGKFILLMFILVVILRVLWVVVFSSVPEHDAAAYNIRAQWLLEGKGYVNFQGEPEVNWYPGYPFFLLIIYRIFGYSILIPKIFNILFACGIAFCIYRIAKILFSETVARFSVLIYALMPSSVAAVDLVIPDTLFVLILYCSLFLILGIKEGADEKKRLIIAGLLLGVGALLKAIMLLMPLCLFFMFILCQKIAVKKAFVRSVILFLFMAIVVAPWTLRNYRALHRFVPVCVGFGEVFFMGNNPEASGTYYELANSEHGKFYSEMPKHEFDKKATALAVDYVQKYPVKFVKMGFKKLFYAFSRDNYFINTSFQDKKDGIFKALKLVIILANNLLYYLLLGLCALAQIWIVLNLRKNKYVLKLWGTFVMLYFSGIIFVTVGVDKYHYSVMPFIIMYASYFLSYFIKEDQDSLKEV